MKFKFKLFIFVHYFSIGLFGPYLVVFLNQKGYTGSQIGILLAVLPISGLLFQPVWSYLSDIFNQRRLFLVIGSLGLVVASVGLTLVESFFIAILFAVLFSAMHAPIGSITTAIVLDYLEENDAMDSYSLLRLWGSLGFAVSSIIMGGLFLDKILIYFPWFIGGNFLILAGLSLLLPDKGQPFTYSGVKDLVILVKNSNFLLYLVASIFIGATMGIYSNYQTLFLQSLGASPWLVGGIVSLQAVLEIPMMLMVPFLLTHLSIRWLILMGALILPVRWFLYIFIQNPLWIIPTQLAHGVAVISFYVVGVTFIDKLVDPKWRATGQSLYSSVMMGIGSGVGVFMAGNILERLGIRSIWYLNLLLGSIGLVLIYFTLYHRPSKKIKPTGELSVSSQNKNPG